MRVINGIGIGCASVFAITTSQVLMNGPLTGWDRRIANYYRAGLIAHGYAEDSGYLRIAHWLGVIGQPWIGCVIVGVLSLLISSRTRRLRVVAVAVSGLGLAGVGTWSTKELVPRSSISFEQLDSYPSGHTCVAVVAAGLVAALVFARSRHSEWLALASGGTWGAIMAWGRVANLSHWFSDAVAGWCLGVIALVIALGIAAPNPRPSVTVTCRKPSMAARDTDEAPALRDP